MAGDDRTKKSGPKPFDGVFAGLFADTPMAHGHALAPDLFWRRMFALNEEIMRFGMRRAERYQDFFRDLSRCETPIDAFGLYGRAAQATVQDYIDETSRMAAHFKGDEASATRRRGFAK